MRRDRVRAVAMALGFLLAPALASAQAIAGVVRDTSGAVLPGVSVEAASPALIEKVRTAVTNDEGLYRITDLRPGIYEVTFTLSGFNAVKRPGLELVTGFTATVNADLQVGAISETVTVTGASPMVDVQNVRTQTVVAREVLDALPLAKSFGGYNSLIPGMAGGTIGASSRDVGGTTGETPVMPYIHGSDPGLAAIDGLKNLSFSASADRHRLFVNSLTVNEVVVETGNGSAEAWSGGANIDVVSKDGGNTFNSTVAFDYIGKGWDANNLNDELRARGVTDYNKNKQTYDVGGSFGGPLKRDKLWFFVSPRAWGTQSYVAGIYYNNTPHTMFYSPDLSRPSIFERQHRDLSGRVTWQAASAHKLVFQSNNSYSYNVNGAETASAAPDGGYVIEYQPQRMLSVNWTHPATSRLLFEASGAFREDYNRSRATKGGLPTDRSILETTINLRYGAQIGGSIQTNGVHPSNQIQSRFSASYITGSHAFKVGVNTLSGYFALNGSPNYPEEYTFTNQVPISLTQWAMPNHAEVRMKMALGLFAQDQWTMGRLTLNLGVRLDSINAYSPEQSRPAGVYLPSVTFPAVHGIPNWNDVSPRVGVAYDLFGNGKTAIKASAGRYLQSNNYSLVFALATSPAGSLALNTTRTWNDSLYPVGDPRRGNYVPDCDLQSKGANGECGAMGNQNFGTTAGATLYADELKHGWGVSPYIWETQVAVQHELAPRVGLTLGYFRTWHGNIRATDNLSVTPGDFDPYCITAPTDARLPGGGGYQVCGLYDVSRARFGQVQNLMIDAPGNQRIYNGIDALINARLGKGIMVIGGVNTGSQVIDNCAAPDVPAQFCRTEQPWSAGTEVKLNVVYPLPWWGIQTAATFRNGAGLVQQASFVATNAEIAPSLGRNLSSCASSTGPCNATATIQLVEPETQYENRGTQIDFRLSKIFHFGPRRLQANLDAYNLTNAADVLAVQNRYGPQWLRAINVLASRMFKVSAQFDF
jgi:hypothetical protein